MAMVLISHDLGVVAEHCDRVAVMYAGRIIEEATAIDLFADPRHPYTRGLIGASPVDGRPAAAADRHAWYRSRSARDAARLRIRAAMPERRGTLRRCDARHCPGRPVPDGGVRAGAISSFGACWSMPRNERAAARSNEYPRGLTG